MKLVALIVLISAVGCSLTAQPKPDTPDYQSKMDEARAAYDSGQWLSAARLYVDAAAYPETESFRSGIYYNAACSWSLAGEADSAFAYINRALTSGYDNVEWLKLDTDFDSLRNNHRERFDSLLVIAPEIIRRYRIDKTPVAVMAYDNFTGQVDLSRYSWDSYNSPAFDTLRTAYGLAEIAGRDSSEFNRMRNILHWVHTRWEHVGDNQCPDADGLKLLRLAEKGERFRCVEYSVLLANCLTALGYPARVVGLQMDPVAFGTGRGHVVTEVWSNEYQKWILLDGQNDNWWVDGDGSVLSADECRWLLLDSSNATLRMVGQSDDRNYENLTRTWRRYFHHLVYNTNETYFGDDGHGKRFEYLSAGVMPELYFQGYPRNLSYLSDSSFAYPSLNQTSITLLHPGKPGDSLKVTLRHSMPFFDRYEIRVDQGGWIRSDSIFVWRLHPGENGIEARAVNKAGIYGKTSRVLLQSSL